MKTWVLLAIPMLLFSCLKKIDEADELNTNMFDREYVGGQWYVVEDVFSYINNDGQNKVRFQTVIPEENLPELKPSAILIEVTGFGGDSVAIIDFVRTSSGDYESPVDLPYVGATAEYCISMGIYLEDEEESINTFSECRNL